MKRNDLLQKGAYLFWIGMMVVILVVGTGMAMQHPFRDQPVSFVPCEDTFYTDQLTQEEQEIYDQLERQLLHFKPRVIELESPVSQNTIARIGQVIDMNDDRFYYYAMLLPLDREQRAMELMESDEKDVWYVAPLTTSMIYLNAPGETEHRCAETDEDFRYFILYPYEKQVPEIQGVELVNRMLEAGLTPSDVTKFKQMRVELDAALDRLVSLVPKDATQTETIRILCEWFQNNLVYDYEGIAYCRDLNREFDPARWEDELYSHRTCAILKDTAVCSGFAQITRSALSRLGIHNYIVLGDAGGDHAWIEAQFGEHYRVFDPTFYTCGYEHGPLSDYELRERYGNQKFTIYAYDPAIL